MPYSSPFGTNPANTQSSVLAKNTSYVSPFANYNPPKSTPKPAGANGGYAASTVQTLPDSMFKQQPNNIWQDVSDFFNKSVKKIGDVANSVLDAKNPILGSTLNAGDKTPTIRKSIQNVLQNTDPALGMVGKVQKIPSAIEAIKGGVTGLAVGSGLQAAAGQAKEDIIKSAPMNFLFGAAFGAGEGKKLTPLEETKGTVKLFDFLKKAVVNDTVKDPVENNNFSRKVIDRYGLPETMSIAPAEIQPTVFSGNTKALNDFLKTTDIKKTNWNDSLTKGRSVNIPTESLGNLIQKPYWDDLKDNLKPIETPSKLGLRVENTAIEKKLVTELKDLPGYEKMNMKEEAARAADIIKTNPQQAYDIALGKIEPPKGLKAESVFKAIESSITTPEQAIELAHSPLVKQSSELGQRIKALDVKTSDSPVEAINQIINARAKAITEKTGRTVDQATNDTIKEIDNHIKEAAPSKLDVASFIKEIQC